MNFNVNNILCLLPQELVASHINQDSKHADVLAARQGGGPLFPDPSGTYYVLQEEKQAIRNREVASTPSYMQLKWDGDFQHSTQLNQVSCSLIGVRMRITVFTKLQLKFGKLPMLQHRLRLSVRLYGSHLRKWRTESRD